MLCAFAEQPGICRAAERGAPAPADEPVADVIVDRDQMPVRRRMFDDGSDLVSETRRDALVGVDLDDPLATAGGNAGIAARTFALPGALDDFVGEFAGDVRRAVGAAIEHDDDLVGEGEA